MVGFYRNAVVAAVAAGSMLLAGCGDAGSPSSPFSSTPSSAAPEFSDSAGSGSGSSTEEDSGQGGGTDVGDVLEKNADGGIWFDEEPQDPLEKLVFASQQFVDQPLQLRPIEGEGVDPAFVGKPDICDPQAAERFEALGISKSTGLSTFDDETVYFCSYTVDQGMDYYASIIIGHPNYSVKDLVLKQHSPDLVDIESGKPEPECTALLSDPDGNLLLTSYEDLSRTFDSSGKCRNSELVRQLIINVQGGGHAQI